MQNLDDLARAAEEAEVTDEHSLPITDAELGETAAEGAQVVLEGNAPAPTPIASGSQPMQVPTSTPVMPMEQAPLPTPSATPVPVVSPVETAPIVASEPLAPFNSQIMQDTAPKLVPMPAQPVSAPVQPMQPAPQPIAEQPTAQQVEQPTPPPAAGTMPGQTVSPQTVATTPSHIIPESFPKPVTGVDPLSGIAV
jgi:hypothetical protein